MDWLVQVSKVLLCIVHLIDEGFDKIGDVGDGSRLYFSFGSASRRIFLENRTRKIVVLNKCNMRYSWNLYQ